MRANPSVLVFALLLAASTAAQPVHPLGFMGRDVTVTGSERDPGGFPKGPASVCLDGPPQRQCYTAPQKSGNDPKVTVVQLKNDLAALLFSAESGGTSGWSIHFALLRPEQETNWRTCSRWRCPFRIKASTHFGANRRFPIQRYS
jgi:hypothetical protein